jgi:hypothetical protein
MNPELPNTPVTPTRNADGRVAEINAQIKSSPLGNLGIVQAPSALNLPVPKTLNAADVGGAKSLVIPPTSSPTGYAGLGEFVTGTNTTVKTDLQKELEAKQNTQAAEAKANKSTLSTIYEKIAGVPAKKDEIYKDEGVDTARKAVDEYTSQIEAEQLSLRRRAELVDKREGGSVAGKDAEIQRLTKESVSKQADLAILQNAALRKFDTVKAIADRKIDAELEPLKLQLDAAKFFFSENKDDLTATENKLFQTYITQEERKYEETKTAKKALSDTKIELLTSAGSQNAPESVKQAIQAAATPEEAIRAAGQYAGDIQAKMLRTEQLKTERLQQQKIQNEIDNNKPITGEWGSVVNSVLSLVPATSKQSVKQAIGGALATGDYTTAYAQVANAVEQGLTGTTKTTFADARTDIGVLTGLRGAIENYTNSGGDIGFLKGTADQIAKKFGQLATDPKFASLAVQLEREFQAYRLAMTGAAFSPEESSEYAKVNPRSNATLDLNLATIDGALGQLTNRVTSTINTRVPEAKKLQEKLEGAQPTTQAPTTPKLSNDDAYAQYLKAVNGVPANAQIKLDSVFK